MDDKTTTTTNDTQTTLTTKTNYTEDAEITTAVDFDESSTTTQVVTKDGKVVSIVQTTRNKNDAKVVDKYHDVTEDELNAADQTRTYRDTASKVTADSSWDSKDTQTVTMVQGNVSFSTRTETDTDNGWSHVNADLTHNFEAPFDGQATHSGSGNSTSKGSKTKTHNYSSFAKKKQWSLLAGGKKKRCQEPFSNIWVEFSSKGKEQQINGS